AHFFAHGVDQAPVVRLLVAAPQRLLCLGRLRHRSHPRLLVYGHCCRPPQRAGAVRVTLPRVDALGRSARAVRAAAAEKSAPDLLPRLASGRSPAAPTTPLRRKRARLVPLMRRSRSWERLCYGRRSGAGGAAGVWASRVVRCAASFPLGRAARGEAGWSGRGVSRAAAACWRRRDVSACTLAILCCTACSASGSSTSARNSW